MYRNSRTINPNNASKKKAFEDVVCGSVSIPSDWQSRRLNRSKRTAQTQTSDDLYNLQEAEVQTGRFTNIYQAQVDANHGNGSTTLLEFVHENRSKFTSNVRTSSTSTQANTVDWSQQIEDGFVTVDCEVETEPHTKVETDAFIEYVDYQKHCGVQTEKMSDLFNFPSTRNESKEHEDDEKNDYDEERKSSTREGKYDDPDEQKDGREISALPRFREYLPMKQPQRLLSFLQKALPLVEEAIRENNEVDAFPHLRNERSADLSNEDNEDENTGNRIPLWKILSVDLEKKKVLFPDWTKAKHFPGVILKVTTTRNKERVYDIEYEDGSRYFGVREEYLRLLDDPDKRHGGKKGANPASQPPPGRLFEGMRVFCKVTSRQGQTKYYLGRIQKVHGKNTYDVEILETSKIETGVMGEDLLVGGLQDGYRVEARKPLRQTLQSTSLGWNATGSMLGITYGKNDLYGWCDLPGALCCWNVFNKTFDPLVPDLIIDHSCCLMAVAFHPIIPTIVAVGSYNGEVMIWDLLKPDKPLAISSVIDYSHKESITELRWIKAVNTPSHFTSNNLNELDAWQLVSGSIDGRILYWSIANRLALPLKGYLLYGKNSQKFDSRRQLAVTNASITALALSSAVYQRQDNSNSGSSNSATMFTPKWMMIGETNGEMIRVPIARLANKWITAETVRSFPSVEDVFVALNKKEEPFGHHPHIGTVASLDWSPFHRNLFLSGGSDGRVKLFHILDPQPLEVWEPVAAGSQAVDALQFTTITAVKFSPHRPLVFAVATSNGFIYLYDLTVNRKLPVVRLEPNEADLADPSETKTATTTSKPHSSVANTGRSNAIITIAFNQRQRDLFAACDWYGKVFIWRLNWSLANRKVNEMDQLNELAQAFTSKR